MHIFRENAHYTLKLGLGMHIM